MYMTPGSYPVQETAGGKRCFDLVIQERQLDGELYQALKMTNDMVYKVNQCLANPRRGGNMMTKLVRKISDQQPFLNDIRGSGRLVKVFAILNHAVLAVTYKVDGRKVSRIDAVQNMARDIRHLRAFVSHIEQRGDLTDHGFFGVEKRELKQNLDQVKAQINLAEQSRTRVGLDKELSNEPIAKCLYPEGVNLNKRDVWHGYRAFCQEKNGSLHVETIKATIGGVNWLTGELIELVINQQPSRFFVTPLKTVLEGHRDDEVRVGDIAMLLGQYVAIAERYEDSSGPKAAFSMINCLRIVSLEEQNQSRRGKNRIQEFDAKVECCFK